MIRKPRLLDLFCCAGGAGAGYAQAGFDVVGVDIKPQSNYPFEFIQADCLALDPEWVASFDAIHASPPCQAHTLAQRIRNREHPDLIAATRDLLKASGRPWIIENVEGAPLINPITLCGSMFPELRVYRHRLFESNIRLTAPGLCLHSAPLTKMGRPVVDGAFMHVVGNFSGAAAARKAMGIEWMTRDELREAVPPAYTKHLGSQLLAQLQLARAA